jgi:hypothetical protein
MRPVINRWHVVIVGKSAIAIPAVDIHLRQSSAKIGAWDDSWPDAPLHKSVSVRNSRLVFRRGGSRRFSRRVSPVHRDPARAAPVGFDACHLIARIGPDGSSMGIAEFRAPTRQECPSIAGAAGVCVAADRAAGSVSLRASRRPARLRSIVRASRPVTATLCRTRHSDASLTVGARWRSASGLPRSAATWPIAHSTATLHSAAGLRLTAAVRPTRRSGVRRLPVCAPASARGRLHRLLLPCGPLGLTAWPRLIRASRARHKGQSG